jgi:1-phosphofructokinase family hexose kinase
MILCLALSPSVDTTFVVDHLSVGDAHRPQRVVTLPGGKGINVARAVHSLDGEVMATGVVGGHSGRWLADTLTVEGVPHALAKGADETRTCFSAAAVDTQRLTEFYPTATPVQRDEWVQLEARTIELMDEQTKGWLVLSGSFPLTVPVRAISTLTTAAHRRRWKVALDTSGPPLIAALDAEVDLIKVNRAEAAGAVGDGDLPQLVVRLSKYATTAIVTNGADGAYALNTHIVGDSAGLYTVGSGDCFLGGYLTALQQGAGQEQALRLAVGAATANTEQPGAARFDPERARQLATTAVFGRW